MPVETASPRRRAVAVLMSRFPSVTETFILRKMIEMERQQQPVRLVPMLKESPPVVHDAAKPWTARALYTRYIDGRILAANLRALARHPLRYVWLLLRLLLGTITRPSTFVRTLAVFPKSVFLAKQLEDEGVGHVHAHFATHPTTMALIISSLSNVTFSFTVHAHDIKVDRSLLHWKVREARFIRSISDFNRRFLEDLYAEARGKIDVIHVGIEPEMYAGAGEPADGIPRVLCVAAHKPYKGLPVLVEACRILRDEGVAFCCDVVGHGPMHDELAAMIAAAKLEGTLNLVGPRPQEEVTKMMAAATLFVLPSIIASDGQMEGIPVALMEAMASARAVVSTSISGIPELIESGVSGILVAPGDAQAFAKAMRSLLEDREGARQMGLRGQEKVRRDFALPTCVAQLVARLDREAAS